MTRPLLPLLLVGCGLYGQQQPQTQAVATANLASNDACKVAWAAHHLARGPERSHVPELVRTLRSWRNRNDIGADFARLHVLDALVQLNARVAAADLTPFLDGITDVAAFALLAREPRANEPELLKLFASELPDGLHAKDLKWWATGDMLCQQRATGFAAVLINEMEFELVLDVYLPSDPSGARCGGAFGTRSGTDIVARLPSFPPAPVYNLAVNEPGCRAIGTSQVGYSRRLAKHPFATGRSWHNYDTRLRLGWLEQLADLDVGSVWYERIDYRNPKAFRTDVEALQARIDQELLQMLDRLVKAKAIPSDKATELDLQLKVNVSDLRAGNRNPLPKIPKLHRVPKHKAKPQRPPAHLADRAGHQAPTLHGQADALRHNSRNEM